MNLATAYLTQPSTQRILSRKPGQEGFSLIELVVVIAVLAVLTAIALPNFLGVSDDASARSAQQAVINAFKECQVFKARGKANQATSEQFDAADLADFTVSSVAAGTLVTTGAPSAASENCFTVANNIGTPNSIMAYPKITGKFPIFLVDASGIKTCLSGTEGTPAVAATATTPAVPAVSGYPTTYNIGCSGASGTAGSWQ